MGQNQRHPEFAKTIQSLIGTTLSMTRSSPEWSSPTPKWLNPTTLWSNQGAAQQTKGTDASSGHTTRRANFATNVRTRVRARVVAGGCAVGSGGGGGSPHNMKPRNGGGVNDHGHCDLPVLEPGTHYTRRPGLCFVCCCDSPGCAAKAVGR